MKTIRLFTLGLALLLSSMCIAQETFIYVSDAGGFSNPPWQILRYDLDGSNPITFIDEELGWPQDIVFLEGTNTVIISNLTTNRITTYNSENGDYIEDFATVSGGPTRMKIGDDNLLYVLQWSNTINEVLRFELDGTPLGAFTSAGVIQSIGMDWDSSGNFYVSSFGGASVRKFDSNGTDMGLFIDSNLTGPTNIWFDENDHLFVLDWSAGDVKEFDENGNFIGIFIDGLTQPEGVDFMDNGNILIGNGGPAQVDQFESNGTFVATTVSSGSGGLIQPNAVILREGSLSIDETDLNDIQITPTIGKLFTISSKDENLQKATVHDITGKLVDTVDLLNTTQWNASHLKEGIYFMTLFTHTNIKKTKKIIVAH